MATGLQWEEFLRDAERSALVYPTGDDPQGNVARQLTHPADPAPRPLRQVCLRVSWQPLHVEDYPEITSCGIALRLFGIWDSGNQPYAWYTFSQDPSGRERKRLGKVLETHGHRLKKLVIDCPRQMETAPLAQTVGAVFPNVETCQYISSHLGAITARRRTVLFCWRDVPPPPPDLSQFRANPPPSMQMIPLDARTWNRHHWRSLVASPLRACQGPRCSTKVPGSQGHWACLCFCRAHQGYQGAWGYTHP